VKPSEALKQHRQRVLELIESYSVTNPRVFGSVSRGQDTSQSDLDLLVDASYDVTYIDLDHLQNELSRVLGVEVDVLTPGDLRPKVRGRILAEARAL
jgi:predicted nucleotidyltransferase